MLVVLLFHVFLLLFARPSLAFLSGQTAKSSHPAAKTSTTSLNSDNVDGFKELSGTLARLDKEWRMQQRDRSNSRWTKIVLADRNEGTEAREYAPEAPVPPQLQDNLVYLLEPPNKSNPSCLLVFIGGAGLGTFPQVVYNEFLTRLSDRLNAAVLTAPYQVGLDHFALSKRTGDLLRRAILHCEEDPARLYSSQLPTYCLAHSLGCKLASIYMAATGQEFEGVGFISFNNFGFSNTISMVREFAREIQESIQFTPGRGIDSEALNGFFTLAENLLGSLNIDFTPSSSETERVISLKYDAERQRKTRLFVFDDDTMDSSVSFLRACRKEGQGATVSRLPGNHLTPVYFQLGLNNLPEEARYMAGDALGGFQSASFGTREELNALVDEVVGFVLGKQPSRAQSEQELLPPARKKDN
mmetsp:Transcript_7626/g.14481  ORF Transcript_7626/g.14481 Transcript_7626/m.14481 type:complete len:414 (+) Transcript_7626:101-1342(+)